MYCSRNVSKSLFYPKPNLTVSVNTGRDFWTKQCLIKMSMLTNGYNTFRASIRQLIQDQYVLKSLKDRLFIRKGDTRKLVRVWAHQCECVVAQRVRRGQQMFSLYSKLWEEHALRAFINRMKQQLARRSKDLLMGAVGVSAYNWEDLRIPDDEMNEHMEELEYGRFLKEKTIMCEICAQDQSKVDAKKMIFCDCPGRNGDMKTWDNWTLFLQREDMVVWRKPSPRFPGSYEYKVFGSYDDVTAEDFLNVQIDTEYRRIWDASAVVLNLIETDPKEGSNSDIIYWEMLWPALFTNRDYVFNRRYIVDDKKKAMLVLSKTTSHPSCPATTDKFRITDYWSSMVIKPYKGFKELGVEYSLTYYDNPGVSIPESITSWVAYKAMPEFLTKLRAAAKEYDNYCREHQCRGLYSTKQDQVQVGEEEEEDDEGECDWVDIAEADENMFDAIMARLDKSSRKTEDLFDKQLGIIKERAFKYIDLTPLGQHNFSNLRLNDDYIETSEVEALNTAKSLNDSSSVLESTTDEATQEVVLKEPKSKDAESMLSKRVTTSQSGSSTPGMEVMTSPSAMVQNDMNTKGYWKYLHPTYYFS